MTISLKHGFKIVFLKKLAKALGIDPNEIEMVFVVPEDIFDQFKLQNALTRGETHYRIAYTGFKQSVVAVPKNVY